MIPSVDSDRLKAIARRHDLSLIVLHGSQARDEAHDGSDVDIGILRTDKRRSSYRAIADIELELCRLVGAQVDVSDLATHDAVFRLEVVRSGRVLFERQPGDWAQFAARTFIAYDDIRPFIDACVEGVGRAARSGSTE